MRQPFQAKRMLTTLHPHKRDGDQIYVSCSNNTIGSMVSGAALYYDASNYSPYPGTSTTIYDLTGNGRNGTM